MLDKKAIIWDWGRTLFSTEDKVEFEESVVAYDLEGHLDARGGQFHALIRTMLEQSQLGELLNHVGR